MAETTVPTDTSPLDRKTSRDTRCNYCGQRRTIDGYDQPTIASCIREECSGKFIIPAYPFTNEEITMAPNLTEAREALADFK